MAARADRPVNDNPQVPDPAVHLYHFWDVAHRMRLVPLVGFPEQKALELAEDETKAFVALQTANATTAFGKSLQARAWAIHHNAVDLLGKQSDDPQPFAKLLGDFIAADKQHAATDPEDDANDAAYENRSNALFSVFAAKPGTIGQSREILRAIVHEMRECELTVGGPLPDAIELALANILDLLDALDPKAGQVRP
jgi:hypothetical protein